MTLTQEQAQNLIAEVRAAVEAQLTLWDRLREIEMKHRVNVDLTDLDSAISELAVR